MTALTSTESLYGVAFARTLASHIVTRYQAGDLDPSTRGVVDQYREVCFAMGAASRQIIDDAVRLAVEKWTEAVRGGDAEAEAHWLAAASSMLAGYQLGSGEAGAA
jgi:hypothetical protein